MSWRLTVRLGPKVRRSEFATLGEAIEAMRDGLAATPRRDRVDMRIRAFEPVHQVAARGELAGPGRARGGVDIRGDGSAEAFVGRMRRQVVEPEPGEDAFSALQRVLADRG